MTLPMADKVRELEAVMRQLPEQFDIDKHTFHHFCEGMYARELGVPAGYCIVGKTHAQQNFFVLVKGRMVVSTPNGMQEIEAPYMAVTQPGDKRVGLAITDCVCLNFHPNPDNERDMTLLESRYITPEALAAPEKELIE